MLISNLCLCFQTSLRKIELESTKISQWGNTSELQAVTARKTSQPKHAGQGQESELIQPCAHRFYGHLRTVAAHVEFMGDESCFQETSLMLQNYAYLQVSKARQVY